MQIYPSRRKEFFSIPSTKKISDQKQAKLILRSSIKSVDLWHQPNAFHTLEKLTGVQTHSALGQLQKGALGFQIYASKEGISLNSIPVKQYSSISFFDGDVLSFFSREATNHYELTTNKAQHYTTIKSKALEAYDLSPQEFNRIGNTKAALDSSELEQVLSAAGLTKNEIKTWKLFAQVAEFWDFPIKLYGLPGERPSTHRITNPQIVERLLDKNLRPTIGDLHANPRKALAFMVLTGLVTMPEETAEAIIQNFGSMEAICEADFQLSRQENIDELRRLFEEYQKIINAIQPTERAKQNEKNNRTALFIGDTICDRYGVDSWSIKLFEKLHSFGFTKILISNHDLSVLGDLFNNDKLKLSEPTQKISFLRQLKMAANNLDSLKQLYKEHLERLIPCDFQPLSGETSSGVFYTHAPLGLGSLGMWEICRDSTLIEATNRAKQKYLQELENSFSGNQPSRFLGGLLGDESSIINNRTVPRMSGELAMVHLSILQSVFGHTFLRKGCTEDDLYSTSNGEIIPLNQIVGRQNPQLSSDSYEIAVENCIHFAPINSQAIN
ncbi:MAG: hypothetical protein SFU25_02110 [Candidatus Caenarcaniphilales bacterium]|nr:hypothetical protein [Candidatus Caenarcaniphilales bacterium]